MLDNTPDPKEKMVSKTHSPALMERVVWWERHTLVKASSTNTKSAPVPKAIKEWWLGAGSPEEVDSSSSGSSSS